MTKRYFLLCTLISALSAMSVRTKPPCNDICPRVYSPVCGTDGRTYKNTCEMKFAACRDDNTLTLASDGPCPDKDTPETAVQTCGQKCDEKSEQPVCGTDGKKYASRCHLFNANCLRPTHDIVQVAGAGKCQDCNTKCPAIYLPVCGSNGETYASECQLRSKNCGSDVLVNVAKMGPCAVPGLSLADRTTASSKPITGKKIDPCLLHCSKILKPVCGDDGITYSNECFMRVQSCKISKKISVAYNDSCTPKTPQ